MSGGVCAIPLFLQNVRLFIISARVAPALSLTSPHSSLVSSHRRLTGHAVRVRHAQSSRVSARALQRSERRGYPFRRPQRAQCGRRDTRARASALRRLERAAPARPVRDGGAQPTLTGQAGSCVSHCTSSMRPPSPVTSGLRIAVPAREDGYRLDGRGARPLEIAAVLLGAIDLEGGGDDTVVGGEHERGEDHVLNVPATCHHARATCHHARATCHHARAT